MLDRVAEELGRLYAREGGAARPGAVAAGAGRRRRRPGGAERAGGAHPLRAQQTADNYVAEAEEFSRQVTHDARVEYEELTAGGAGERRGDPPGGARGGGRRSAGAAGGVPAATPAADRGGARGAGRLPQGLRPGVRVQLRSYLEALLSDVENEWGRADPAALPSRRRGPRRAPGGGRRLDHGLRGQHRRGEPAGRRRQRQGRPGRVRGAAGGLTDVVAGPPACQDRSMFDPATTAAVARARRHSYRRPAAPHRPPLPGQARRRRRRPPGHATREFDAAVNRCRARARRPRAGEGRPARAAVAQLLAVRRARLRDRPARRGPGADQLHARRRRDRLHPRPLRCHAGSWPRTRWPPTADEALAAAGVRGRGPRLDRAVRRRRGAEAGRTSTAGGATAPTHAPDVLVADDDPLRLMYTSGTESRPEGRHARRAAR